MALAPVAYTLWQRFLRFDPADPIWPNRDRFVLSAGHASMLLYSLLFLAERAGGRPRLRGRRRARGQPRRHRTLPPARLEGARPPRVPLDLGGRDDDRAARPGRRDLGRDGDRLEVAGRPLRRRALRLRRLRDRRRRLPDGGRLRRSRLAGRPPEARQPLLGLRQQPHHDRRQDRSSPTATTCRCASRATAGTSSASKTPTTSSGSAPPSRSSRPRRRGRR